jgi:Transposase, Mutator family
MASTIASKARGLIDKSFGHLYGARHPAGRHEGHSWRLIEQTKDAKFYVRCDERTEEPRRERHPDRGRGNGLKGFPEAINANVQTCIVHLPPFAEFVSWKDRKVVTPALKAIFRAKVSDAAAKLWRRLRQVHGGNDIPLSPRADGAIGITSFPSRGVRHAAPGKPIHQIKWPRRAV